MIDYITFSNEVLSMVFFIGLVLNIMWVTELYTMKKAIQRALDKELEQQVKIMKGEDNDWSGE
jgi:hypothetical protein